MKLLKKLLLIIFCFTNSLVVFAQKSPVKFLNNTDTEIVSFESIKAKYDTLIPIFNSLFITYSDEDNHNYQKYFKKTNKNEGFMPCVQDEIYVEDGFIKISRNKKWGVIDSLGNIVVPFICDGIKEISENKGIISVYSGSASLNTGLPRYMYYGTTYFINKEGILINTDKKFSIVITSIADWHCPEFVIRFGTKFYLPFATDNLENHINHSSDNE